MNLKVLFVSDKMYWISIDAAFEAAHGLTFANGVTEPNHTHRWSVSVGVCSEYLDKQGLVMDFLELQHYVDAAIDDFKGIKLENNPCFTGQNASAERVARVIFDRIAARIYPPVRLGYVEVTEAPGCRARYEPVPE